MQVVPAAERERAGQRAVRNRVPRWVELELRTAVELLAVGDDVELSTEHLVVERERFAGVAGKETYSDVFMGATVDGSVAVERRPALAGKSRRLLCAELVASQDYSFCTWRLKVMSWLSWRTETVC